MRSRTRNPDRRRGSVYVVVLGLSLLVAVAAMGAIAAGLSQRRAAEALNDASEAKGYARAAIDLGRLAILQDANWRTDYNSGTWIASRAIGLGTLSLTGIDTIDGNLANRPYDPVVLTGSGYKGRAAQFVQETLVAVPTPIDGLQFALFTPGQLHVHSNGVLISANGTVATNGTLQNDNLLLANGQCFLSSGGGTTMGTISILSGSIAVPPSGVEAMYTALGTTISPGDKLEKCVLGPGVNPFGAANADGVYVIQTSKDLDIRNCRVCGTLVVIAPGKNVQIEQTVLIQPARPDFPALIIDGNAVFQYTSNGTPLTESSVGVNFNPPGAPYNGATNSNTTDTYPSMISGLVHVKGKLTFNGSSSLIHGAVISESTQASDAVNISGTAEIDYDPTLYSSPPQGYTKSVQMVPQRGSIARVVH